MIPTAENILEKHTHCNPENEWEKNGKFCLTNYKKAMIEFAKLHVVAAKKQFKIVFNEIDDPYPFEKKDKLKDVYPLENIK